MMRTKARVFLMVLCFSYPSFLCGIAPQPWASSSISWSARRRRRRLRNGWRKPSRRYLTPEKRGLGFALYGGVTSLCLLRLVRRGEAGSPTITLGAGFFIHRSGWSCGAIIVFTSSQLPLPKRAYKKAAFPVRLQAFPSTLGVGALPNSPRHGSGRRWCGSPSLRFFDAKCRRRFGFLGNVGMVSEGAVVEVRLFKNF